MQTHTIYTYSINELSNEAKKKAIDANRYNLTEFNWWEFIYEDANSIGIKITEFDLDRANYCNIENTLSWPEVAQNILNQHGDECNTYKAAQNFLETHNPIFAEYMENEGPELEEQLINIEQQFSNALRRCYKQKLSDEYEYLLSDECIIEDLESNEYQFLESGKQFIV